MAPAHDDAPYAFADEDTPHAPIAPGPADAPLPWQVVVVDDDEGIHRVTQLALAQFTVDGRPLELAHARSAAEGRAALQALPDAALVLLDVVMETDEAGLALARWVRDELKNPFVRLVLRTGQPGLAPEASVMSGYDIHDYHSKTEMSAQRLRTAVTGAVRAYRDVRTIADQRQGLERVIDAVSTLFEPGRPGLPLAEILDKAASLLPRRHALAVVGRAPLFEPVSPGPVVLAATPPNGHMVGRGVDVALRPAVRAAAEQVARLGGWMPVGPDGLLALDLGGSLRPTLYVEGGGALSDWDRQVLALFCTGAAMALQNRRLALEQEAFRNAYERFVPKALVDLLGSPDVRRVSVGDQVAGAMSVLFVDVRGFTGRSELLGPAGVFSLLNRLFACLGPVAKAHGGAIDKYHGDGVMVLFPGGPRDALAAAVEMHRAVELLNASWALPGGPLALGITVQHGSVMLGTVGYDERFDVTVVSDVANVAARLQELCKRLEANILVGEEAFSLGGAGLDARPLGAFTLRGREQPVRVVQVLSGEPDAVRAARIRTRGDFELGVRLRDGRDWTGAAAAFGRVLSQDPGDLPAVWLAADSLEQHRLRQAHPE